ncbi:MAG: helix-turn-helix domain-containing protein [Deltaproteobacteria bacterium]|nr:helix-turn-helix domain-containing protein [Deltaproteobacteria bacterium]
MEEQYDRLLNQKEVAEWIGMSEAWMEQCRFKGVGIPFIKFGRACRYRKSEVQRWINEHAVGTGI